MRIRNNEPITFQEACELLASQNGSENLQSKIDTLEYLLSRPVKSEPKRAKVEPLRESQPALIGCAECGEPTYPTKRIDVCQDCFYAISGYMED